MKIDKELNMKSLVLSVALVFGTATVVPAAPAFGPFVGPDVVSHSGEADENGCHRARKRNGWHCHDD